MDAVVEYEKTGDAGLDVALSYIGERGFKPDHPAMQAAMKGDFTLIEAELAKLGEKAKGHAAIVNLAKDSYSRKQAAGTAAATATAKAVHEAVGGAANWAAIQAWAAANADPDEKAQLNAAFKTGGVAATAAATYLAGLFAKHGKAAPKSAVKPEAGNTPPNGGNALSPREFSAESQALYAKLGARMEASREYADLRARRQAYRG